MLCDLSLEEILDNLVDNVMSFDDGEILLLYETGSGVILTEESAEPYQNWTSYGMS